MIYVLLDTNILKGELVSKSSFSSSLKQLESWCKSNSITLLFPEVLQKEWTKHSQSELHSIKKATDQHRIVFETYHTKIDEDQISLGLESLNQQVDLIKELFLNHSQSFITAEDLYKVGYERQENKIPPFHNKNASLNDWLIFSSTVRHLLSEDIKEFYFITKNVSDFSDVNNRKSLHPQLLEFAGDLSVKYFTDIQSFFLTMFELGFPRYDFSASNSEEERKSIINLKQRKISLKSDIQAINSLERLFKQTLKDIDFLTYRHLNQFVFSRLSGSTVFSQYNLRTDNNYVYNILRSVYVDEKDNQLKFKEDISFDPTKKNLEKVCFIFKRMRRNSIYYWENDHNRLELYQLSEENCNCIRCQIEKFQFQSIDPSWKNNNETEFEFYLKLGFSWLKLGNFSIAYQNIKQALKIAEAEQNELYIFRAKYNLSKLYIRLRNQFFLDKNYDLILDELKNLEFDPFYFNFQEDLTIEIAKWMSNEHYIHEAFLEISQTKEKIVEYNQISHNGGHSHNGLINQLSFRYSQVKSFLQNNLFYYEDFTEWRNIASAFIEGILASYSTNENSSRLIELNDWVLHQFLKFGDVKKMRVLMQQYKLKDVRYKESFEQEHQVTTLIENIININRTEIETQFFQDEFSKDVFKDKCKEWTHNAMFLIGLIDFNRDFIKSSIIKIIDKIEKEGVEFDISYLQSLLVRRCDLVDHDMLKRLIKFGLTYEKLRGPFFLATISILVKENGNKVNLSNQEFEDLKEPIKNLKRQDNTTLIYLAKIFENDQDQKEYVINQIKIEMSHKDFQYSSPLYLKALLNNIVDLDMNLLEKSIAFLTPNAPILARVSISSQGEAYNYNLNELIDVFYQYNISVLDYPGLLNHSDYYQWLLQLDEFDYSKFKPEWILLHSNRFNYDSRFKKCERLKNCLTDYIKPSMSISGSKVKERYYEIYI